ncbi:MAG: hypothetical protein RIC55_05310 [Pirellulaceae bacterium]
MTVQNGARPWGLLVVGTLLGAAYGFLLSMLHSGFDAKVLSVGGATAGTLLSAAAEAYCTRFGAMRALTLGGVLGALVFGGSSFMAVLLPSIITQWRHHGWNPYLYSALETSLLNWLLTLLNGVLVGAILAVLCSALIGRGRPGWVATGVVLGGYALGVLGSAVLLVASMLSGSTSGTLAQFEASAQDIYSSGRSCAIGCGAIVALFVAGRFGWKVFRTLQGAWHALRLAAAERRGRYATESDGGARQVIPRPEPPPAPKPGIVHLLLWTVGSALVLLFFRRVDAIHSPELPADWRLFRQVMQVSSSMTYGAALASFSMFYFYRRRRSPYPFHPGHWLLLKMGLGILASWLLLETLPNDVEGDLDSNRWSISLRVVVESGLNVLVLTTAAVLLIINRSVTWAVVLLIASLLSFLAALSLLAELDILPGISLRNSRSPMSLVQQLYTILRFAGVTVAQIGAVAAGLLDIVTRTRRDWVHWLGVCCFVSIGVSSWAWIIWSILNPITR